MWDVILFCLAVAAVGVAYAAVLLRTAEPVDDDAYPDPDPPFYLACGPADPPGCRCPACRDRAAARGFLRVDFEPVTDWGPDDDD